MTDMLKNIFTQFIGNWSIERKSVALSDESHILAEAQGTASFKAENPSLLHYREEGTLSVPPNNTRHEYFRSYHYALKENCIEVLYADGPDTGKLYQQLILGADGKSLISAAEHICAADCYTSHYQLHDQDRFSLATTVTGPRKDYRILTEFNKIK